MIESFVDLTYRGLPLGRRIKLTQVRPSTGYLEMPTPMPVGTLVAISTDEGVELDAIVTHIHEQVGGSDRIPGMTVRPALADDAKTSWWQARVGLPEGPIDTALERGKPVTVRPRTHTVPAPPPAGALAEAPVSTEVTATKEMSVFVAPATPPPVRPALREEDAKRTTVMNAVDQELLAQLTQSDGVVEHLVRRTGEHAVVDDGLRTTVMDAIDPAALGLDVTASGSMPAASESGSMPAADDDGDKPRGTPSGVKKRKKKR